VYRFRNVGDLEVKFADAEMLESVEEKINEMEKLKKSGIEIVQGGEHDLVERELKFLYEVYRPITTFGAGGGLAELTMVGKMHDLKKRRDEILLGLLQKERVLVELRKKDYAKMFRCRPEEIYFMNSYHLEDKPKSSKVLITLIPKYDLDRLHLRMSGLVEGLNLNSVEVISGCLPIGYLDKFPNLKEVTQFIYSDSSYDKRPENLGTNLEKVGGVGIEIKDRAFIKSFPISHRDRERTTFPEANDPRLKRIFY
jgi:hypothetical protein